MNRVLSRLTALAAVLLASVFGGGCQTTQKLATVPSVDLERFMGDWYVIAAIPVSIEKNSYNGVESYRLNADGSIATTYTFREGAFDGPQKSYHPTGFVRNRQTNAEWGMQFFWPIRAEYLITYVADDYSATVISRSALDSAWIMARKPVLPDAELARLTQLLREQGYDISKLRLVPQRW